MITDIKREAIRDLMQEIYEATLTGVPELELPQIARSTGIPLDTVEEIGKRLVQNKQGVDLDEDQFNEMLTRYRKIDQIEDAGFRAWKLQGLARKYKRPVQQLTEAYSKALINQCAVKPLSPKEFRALHEAEVEWLVKGWISKGTMLLLHADGGVGKTLFSYELMESVLTGKPWNGYPVQPGKVLLVQTDEPTLVTHERIDIRGIADDAPLAILSDWQVEAIPRLESFIKEQRPQLVIVDSLTSINRACVFSENDTEYARPLLELARMGNTYGCTVIVIHHSNADGNSRGTRAIYNSVSEVWGLKKGEQLNDRQLQVQKTRLGRPPGRYRFRFDDEDFSFEYQGEDFGADNADQSDTAATNEKRIELWFNEGDRPGTPFTAQEVSEFMGLAYDSTRRSLYELWAKGLIKRYRPKLQKQYVYHTGELLSNVTTDQLITTPKTTESVAKPDEITVSAPTDQLITQNTVLKTEKVWENERSVDQLISCAAVGDIVVANANAKWLRSGSQKLPWKEVRPSDKQAPEIPIDLLTATLFDELIQPSKVLEVSKDGQKVKVRQQTTGRTSVFPLSDVCVLKKIGTGDRG